MYSNENERGASSAAGKIDLVRRLVADYQAQPGDDRAAIRGVEDLYEDTAGLPRS